MPAGAPLTVTGAGTSEHGWSGVSLWRVTEALRPAMTKKGAKTPAKGTLTVMGAASNRSLLMAPLERDVDPRRLFIADQNGPEG